MQFVDSGAESCDQEDSGGDQANTADFQLESLTHRKQKNSKKTKKNASNQSKSKKNEAILFCFV